MYDPPVEVLNVLVSEVLDLLKSVFSVPDIVIDRYFVIFAEDLNKVVLSFGGDEEGEEEDVLKVDVELEAEESPVFVLPRLDVETLLPFLCTLRELSRGCHSRAKRLIEWVTTCGERLSRVALLRGVRAFLDVYCPVLSTKSVPQSYMTCLLPDVAEKLQRHLKNVAACLSGAETSEITSDIKKEHVEALTSTLQAVSSLKVGRGVGFSYMDLDMKERRHVLDLWYPSDNVLIHAVADSGGRRSITITLLREGGVKSRDIQCFQYIVKGVEVSIETPQDMEEKAVRKLLGLSTSQPLPRLQR